MQARLQINEFTIQSPKQDFNNIIENEIQLLI